MRRKVWVDKIRGIPSHLKDSLFNPDAIPPKAFAVMIIVVLLGGFLVCLKEIFGIDLSTGFDRLSKAILGFSIIFAIEVFVFILFRKVLSLLFRKILPNRHDLEERVKNASLRRVSTKSLIMLTTILVLFVASLRFLAYNIGVDFSVLGLLWIYILALVIIFVGGLLIFEWVYRFWKLLSRWRSEP